MAWNEPGPGRDPWNQGPKRGDNKPPQLDEVLKRFKERFGGKGGGGGSGGLPKQLPSGVVGLAALLIVLLWLASGMYVVDEQERAVVLRFGQHVGTTSPGLNWHLPWPIESVEVVNVTGVRSVREEATMLTQDENIVDVELSVQYRVSNVEDYVFQITEPDLTLKQATKAAVRQVVGQSKMDFILTDGREEVADETKRVLQDLLDQYKAGLAVTEVNLQQAQPPEPVQASFADAIKAREDQARLKNEAEAYANDRLPRARGAAARQIAEATGYRDQVVAKAEGDASRFDQLLTEYRKSQKVTRERLYLDMMRSVLGGSSKILIDADKSSPMLYLPLDQIIKNAQHKTDNSDPDYVTAPGPSPRSSSGSSSDDDSARSRDRSRP
ncbi:FtsH protease activity modulator HflK [Solimonas terrae]|uniref:Protein HflK n=1 Tax=Solimonas terrae TaxID=1396819 RepID=A0A6M2BND1_9GAMM|nr:FtsH protease activity modulator HflK [Solimonas terrae]NGY03830.1 FtsH protease activity modulator HflK [Solimonas terrae]